MTTMTVGGVTAKNGEMARGVLPVGNFADGSSLEIPFILLNGAEPGPRLYIEAACHGSEINGLRCSAGWLPKRSSSTS